MTLRGVDKLEAGSADFAVCARVDQLPPISRLPVAVEADAAALRRRSTRQACEGCGAPILVGPDVPPGPKRVCTDCMATVQRTVARAAGVGS